MEKKFKKKDIQFLNYEYYREGAKGELLLFEKLADYRKNSLYFDQIIDGRHLRILI